jgi:hypothetical protein
LKDLENGLLQSLRSLAMTTPGKLFKLQTLPFDLL